MDRSYLPLANVKVLDLSQVVAGPYCTLMLADMGAEVVKIEKPGHGDDLRRTVPYEGRKGHEDYFHALNRSKKSVALDLKDPADRATAVQLALKADVLVENFAPGTAERLGLGYDALAGANPKLIYCSMSGFGQTGPYRDRVAMDPVIQAITGIMSVTGQPGGEPTMIGVPLADVISGMFAAYAITSALHVVRRGGPGQHIDLSMQDAMLAALGIRMGEPLQAGIAPGLLGNENPLRVPANIYRTADGYWLCMMVAAEHQWLPFCEAMECPQWNDDPRFTKMALRMENRAALNELVSARFAERSAAAWMDRLQQYRIPFSLVNDYLQALADPQVAHRGLIHELEHPTSGRIRVVGQPWIMSRTPNCMTPPPVLGEHTEAVLADWLAE